MGLGSETNRTSELHVITQGLGKKQLDLTSGSGHDVLGSMEFEARGGEAVKKLAAEATAN